MSHLWERNRIVLRPEVTLANQDTLITIGILLFDLTIFRKKRGDVFGLAKNFLPSVSVSSNT